MYMSEFEGGRGLPPGLDIDFSKMLSREGQVKLPPELLGGKPPESQRETKAETKPYQPKNEVESELASLHERSGRDHPHAHEPQRRIFDLHKLVGVQAKAIEAEMKQKGNAYEGPSLADMKKIEETVFRMANRQPISPEAKEKLVTYVTDNFDVWKKRAQRDGAPEEEKVFASASEKLFGEFRNMAYGAETYQDIYPQFGPEPTAAREAINKLKESATLDFNDLKTVLDAADSDTTTAETSAEWKQFKDIVGEVKKFVAKHKLGMRLRPRNVTVTVSEGKIKVAWAKKSEQDPDPANGFYVFDASPKAYIDAPLSLNRAEYNIDSFAMQYEMIKLAKETASQLERGETVDKMKVLSIFQILEQHRTETVASLTEGTNRDNGVDQDALAKLVAFVKERGKIVDPEPDEEGRAFAKGDALPA